MGLHKAPLQDSPFDGVLPTQATFTIGADAGTTVNVAIQLYSGGFELAEPGAVQAYLSTLPTGMDVIGTAPSGGWAIGTDGLLLPIVSGKYATLVSEADGDIDVTITEAGAAVYYLVLILPNGRLEISDAITFTA